MSAEFWKVNRSDVAIYLTTVLVLVGLTALMMRDRVTQSTRQQICPPRIGSNVLENADLRRQLVRRHEQPCQLPLTVLLRAHEILDGGLSHLFSQVSQRNVVPIIRVAADENDGNYWGVISPEKAEAVGEKVGVLTRDYQGEIEEVILTSENEPNNRWESAGAVDPEAAADRVVGMVNGAGDMSNVRVAVPPLAFCQGKCPPGMMEPDEFYGRLYAQMEKKIADGISDSRLRRLITQQWLKLHLGVFAVNFYPQHVSTARSEMSKIAAVIRGSGLWSSSEPLPVILTEVGLPNGLADRGAGKYACQVVEQLKSMPGLDVQFATVYARNDGDGQRQLGFYFRSPSCDSVEVFETVH